MSRLSVVAITLNEEANIGAMIESVAFADEIVVVDDSTDGTPQRAAAAGARVVRRAWDGYAAQRQAGFDLATGDWILWLDADERVTPELRVELLAVVDADGPADAYEVARKHFFIGDWLRHGGEFPAYQVRLVRRPLARISAVAVHEVLVTEGLSVGQLRSALDHFSSPTLRARVRKVRQYARLSAVAAQSLPRDRRRPPASAPLRRFAYVFIRLSAYRDGWRGLLWALSCALEQQLIRRHLRAL